MRAPWTTVGIAIAALLLCGCPRTFSPPLRTASTGAPGRVRSGDLAGGAAGHVRLDRRLGRTPDAQPGGGPALAIGITDWLSVDGAYEWAHDVAVSGSGAVRFTLDGKPRRRAHLRADLAFGGGGGRGGLVCSNIERDDGFCPGDGAWDGRRWLERPFGGGLAEMGLGWWRGDDAATYARLRSQVTRASGTPLTVWLEALMGAQVRIADAVGAHLGIGVSLYHNRHDPLFGSNDWSFMDNNLGYFFEAGLDFELSLAR